MGTQEEEWQHKLILNTFLEIGMSLKVGFNLRKIGIGKENSLYVQKSVSLLNSHCFPFFLQVKWYNYEILIVKNKNNIMNKVKYFL